MSIILTKSLEVKNQALVIRIKYDPKTNTVDEIKNIDLIIGGKMFCVGSLITKFFDSELNKIIDATDWREEHRQQKNFYKNIFRRVTAAVR